MNNCEKMSEVKNYTNLKDLLKSWNLLVLLQHFQDEGINIEELQMMKLHHMTELLQKYKLGIRIRFEYNFEIWRRNCNKPLQEQQGNNNQETRCLHHYNELSNTCSAIKTEPSKQYQSRATNTDTNDLVDTGCNTLTTLSPSSQLQLLEVQSHGRNPRTLRSLTTSPQTNSTTNVTQAQTPPTSESSQLVVSHLLDGGVQQHVNTPITLLHILKNSGPKGVSLIEFYQKHNHLTNSQRTLLIHLIVSFFENHDYHLSLNVSHNLEWQILKMFPTEQLENYRTEKRGKIYVKFCNMKRYKRDKSGAKRLKRGSDVLMNSVNANKEEVNSDANDHDEDDDLSSICMDQSGWNTAIEVKTENISDDDVY